MNDATPRPWSLRERDEYFGNVTEIVGAEGKYPDIVANNEPYYPWAVSEADQALIVEAVNNYEHYKEAARLLPKLSETFQFHIGRIQYDSDGAIAAWLARDLVEEKHAGTK